VAEFNDGQVSLTMKRVNRVVLAIRGLAHGHLSELEEDGTHRGSWSAWKEASAAQREIVSDLWKQNLSRATWGGLTDGIAALRRCGKSGSGGYTHVSGGEEAVTASVLSPALVRGQVCPLIPENVSVPPPGTIPIDLIKVSQTGRPFLDNVEKMMVLDGDKVARGTSITK
jgi:hypothetical protein